LQRRHYEGKDSQEEEECCKEFGATHPTTYMYQDTHTTVRKKKIIQNMPNNFPCALVHQDDTFSYILQSNYEGNIVRKKKSKLIPTSFEDYNEQQQHRAMINSLQR
jgi:hypothetical protein